MADDANDQVLPDFVPLQSDPTFLDTLGASFRRQNLVGSLLTSENANLKTKRFLGVMGDETPITDDEINKEIEAAGMGQHAEIFADVTSREEFNAVMNDALQEQEDMRIADASGWTGFGTDLVAGVIDPTTLLPVGAGLKVGKAANTVLGAAARLMAGSALETTLSEVGLQQTQQIRTLEESAMNIGGSMVLSSLLGASVARATMGRSYGKIANQLETDMAAMAKNEPKLLANQKSDVILEQLQATAPTVVTTPPASGAAKAVAATGEILDADNLSPSQRLYANSFGIGTATRYAQMWAGRSIPHEMMAAESPTARQFIQEVAELPMRTQGATDGVANPISVQSLMTEFEGIRATATRDYIAAYRQWRGRTLDILGKDYEAFSRRVASAMVNGDDMLDPHVTTAVKVMKDADEKVAKRAVKAGLMRKLQGDEAQVEAVRRKRGLADQASKEHARLQRQALNALGDDIRTAKTPEDRAAAVRRRAEQTHKELFEERDSIAKELSDAKDELRVLKAARSHPDMKMMSGLATKRSGFTKARNHAVAEGGRIAETFAKETTTEGDDFTVAASRKAIDKAKKQFKKLAQSYIKARVEEMQGGEPVAAPKNLPEALVAILDQHVTRVRQALKAMTDVENAIPSQIKKAAGEEGAGQVKQLERRIARHEKALPDYDKQISDVLRQTEADATRLGEVDVPAGSAAAEKGRGFRQGDRLRDPLLWPELLWSPARKIKRKYLPHRLLADDQAQTFKFKEKIAYLQRREYLIEKGELNERSLADPTLTRKEVLAILKEARLHAEGAHEVILFGTYKGGKAESGQVKKGRRGSVLDRNIALSDHELLKHGWIDNDAVELLSINTRQLGADALIAGKFKRAMTTEELRLAESNHPDAYWIDGDNPTMVPDLDMTVAKERIVSEYKQLISNATDEGRRNSLKLERERMLQYVDESIDMLRGTHRVEEHMTTSARNLSALRNYNFALRMGSNVISSIADIGSIMLRHGPTAPVNFWGRRLSHMVKNGSFKVDRADLAREARAAGIAIEQEVQSRVAAQMDLMDPAANAVAGHNKFQQVSRYLAQAGSKVYLINSWTNAMRRASFGIYQDRVIRFALDRKSMSKSDAQWLADLGISSKHLDRIAEQAKKGGAEDHTGVWLANTDKWDDDEIRSIFWAAGRKEVNAANVAPSALEKPRAFQGPVMGTILQFTSFAFASTARVLGQSAQRVIADGGFGRDSARVYMGLSAMVGLGMLSTALHNGADTWFQRANGEELTEWEELPDFDKNPGFWVYQGISRSGTLGLFSQFADVFENATGYGPMGLTQEVFGDEEDLDPVSRYGQAQPLKNVFGPTAGLANDVITGVFDLTRQATDEDQDLKQKTARKLMRNFMPLLNAFYLKSITKEATRSGLEAMGIDE